MNQKLKFFLFGIVFSIVVVLLISAGWINHPIAPNVPNFSPMLTCSADGKIIYAADNVEIYKSEDFGNTWVTVSPDKTNIKK